MLDRLHFSVHYGDHQFLARQGFGLVARLPFIVDSRPAYHRLGSRYLIDRGLGKWHPYTRNGREVEPPAPRTIDNYAHWLANFLEWAEIRGVDLYTCNYREHVSGQYKREMIGGLWSKDGRSLQAGTINPRLVQAGDFLTWLCDKGFRQQAFEVPTEVKQIRLGSATDSHGHRPKEVAVRLGLVEQRGRNKKNMPYPTHQEVGDWLDRVETKYGYARRLMCEAILLTAVRRAEVVGWRTNTIPPDRDGWLHFIANPDKPYEDQTIKVEVMFGTKGKAYSAIGKNGQEMSADHGDKIGPRDTIHVPVVFADKLHEYLTDRRFRPAALERLKQRLRKQGLSRTEILARLADTVHLFLDEQTGERINDRQLYEAWTGVELPVKNWSPHRGRDWWACSVLMRELDFLRRPDLKVPNDLVRTAAMDVIQLQIQPQLRHATSQTTMIYLHWVIDRMSTGLAITYEKDFDKRVVIDEAGISPISNDSTTAISPG
jgi:integrase